MARNESDREDLMREATALVERIELAPHSSGALGADTVVAGFRANGAFSLFIGGDLVYQFNAAGELRRAYRAGLLYKASRGRLVSLERVRQTDEVQLVSHELTDDERRDFVNGMSHWLRELTDKLNCGYYTVVSKVPADAPVFFRVLTWLMTHTGLPIADSPRV